MANSKEILKRFSYSEGGAITAIVNLVYPVGCYYWSSEPTTPEELFGVGKWERIEKKYLFAAPKTQIWGDIFFKPGRTFGADDDKIFDAVLTNVEADVTLTASNIPKIDCGTFGVHQTRDHGKDAQDIRDRTSGGFTIEDYTDENTNVDRGGRGGCWWKYRLKIGNDNPDPIKIEVKTGAAPIDLSMPALCAYCWHRIE